MVEQYKTGEEITIPTSYLGSKYGIGKIIYAWGSGTKIAVDFSGHIGHYTVANHKIHRIIKISGMNFIMDNNIPVNAICVNSNDG